MLSKYFFSKSVVGLSYSASTKANMSLNMRLAAPDAGTNFTTFLPAALYCSQLFSNLALDSSVVATIPCSTLAAASRRRKGNPVLNSFN